MSEDRTIRGETTMTWGDQARLSMRPVVRSMLVVSLAMAVTILLVWAITSSDSAWLLLRHEPFEALGLVARDSWAFFVAGFVLLLMLLIGLAARAFHRLPDVNCRIAYEATARGLVTRDAADFAFTVPWSMVIRVHNSDQLMRMQLAAGVWRTVFWRVFAAEDREQILRWARQPDVQKVKDA